MTKIDFSKLKFVNNGVVFEDIFLIWNERGLGLIREHAYSENGGFIGGLLEGGKDTASRYDLRGFGIPEYKMIEKENRPYEDAEDKIIKTIDFYVKECNVPVTDIRIEERHFRFEETYLDDTPIKLDEGIIVKERKIIKCDPYIDYWVYLRQNQLQKV